MNDRKKQIVQGIIATIFGGLYLLNPTSGIIELLPDILPLAGNIDEATATLILLWGINSIRPGAVRLPDNAALLAHKLPKQPSRDEGH